jgi:N-acyl-D-amino-acid deacylase
MLDLIIRNGTIIDGTGLPRYAGDVGIRDGKLASVGRRLGDAEALTVVDAAGKVVAPGFVDPHTHYDAQLCFDPYAYPAIEHGITSVITGNCSLSLAPVRPAHRERFSKMFRLIEEMPEEAFDVGVDWRWGESFGGMLDAVRADLALNVAPLLGHSVLRMYVMGDDPRRAATADEIATMCDVLRECLEAGAVGLSTSYVDVEDDMRPVPCRFAEHAELEALSAVLAEHGRMLQVVHEFYDAGLTVSRIELLAELSLRYGIATTLSPLFHTAAAPGATDQVMEAVERAWARGARVWPQVQTRPIDISWTMGQRSIMFLAIPGWWNVLAMNDPVAKLEALGDPTIRQTLLDGMTQAVALRGPGFDPGNYVVRDVALDANRDLVGRTLTDIAADRGTTPAELLIDLSVEEELGTWFMRAEIGHSDPDAVGALLAHPLVHVGASDGGAHVGSFATYGDTGFLVSRYVRETGALRLEEAIKKITSDTAAIWGLPNRGLVREGYAADLVVFDPTTLDRGPEVASDDFPGDGIRWVRHSVGMDAVVVGGEPTWTAAEGYVKGARAGVIATRT